LEIGATRRGVRRDQRHERSSQDHGRVGGLLERPRPQLSSAVGARGSTSSRQRTSVPESMSPGDRIRPPSPPGGGCVPSSLWPSSGLAPPARTAAALLPLTPDSAERGKRETGWKAPTRSPYSRASTLDPWALPRGRRDSFGGVPKKAVPAETCRLDACVNVSLGSLAATRLPATIRASVVGHYRESRRVDGAIQERRTSPS
jgi:hypothetical protein